MNYCKDVFALDEKNKKQSNILCCPIYVLTIYPYVIIELDKIKQYDECFNECINAMNNKWSICKLLRYSIITSNLI